ncbi:MAG: ABC transporter permease [Rhodospirillales bacterium]|nr:ABC transporter permease [Rhodospirillales bacterium]MDE0380592.1 ABC transporter permease [Rhodospirillales bacterium]
MLRLILGILVRRLAVLVPMLLIVSVMVFVILRLLPADPLALVIPPNATPADVAELRAYHGLDGGIVEQYVVWLERAVQGDLGHGIGLRDTVMNLIGETLPATIELALFALVLSLIIGFGGGLVMFRLRGTRREAAADLTSIAMLSIPDFLWALFLILAFGVGWAVLPFSGRVAPGFALPDITGFVFIDAIITAQGDLFLSALEHILLPGLALALAFSPLIMRVLRSSLMDVINEDYIQLARLRGVGEGRILLRHALKNAVLPTLTLVGVQFGFLFGGTLLVEIIFAYPGIGNLMVKAIRNTDFPVIQGVALTYCIAVLVTNLVVDVSYVILNPKLRAA